jgi:hypothetical protein
MSRWPISTQGLSADLTRADGSYDSVERGEMGRDELRAFLARVSMVAEPDYDSGEDICPPSVYIGEDGGVAVFLDGGALREMETTAEVTPDEVVALAAGEETVEAIASRKPGRKVGAAPRGAGDLPAAAAKRPTAGRKLLAVLVASVPGCAGLGGTVGLARWDSEYREILIIGVIMVTLSLCRLVYTLVRG